MNQYRPRNAWEGADFQEQWCVRCQHEPTCPILTASYFGPVEEWVTDEDGPRCTAFEEAHDYCIMHDCAVYSEDNDGNPVCGFDDEFFPITPETLCPHTDEREPVGYYADLGDVELEADDETD